ncbi:transmembrane protein, putative (macronuclear) [Tetrahymena thermophila SB210]|uniref:Transmembrane protein, putative n=1 Tax=Tetrahymena thermophila (strain SB210) TaxID=312017 RepID=W7XAR6_TETTS|nr:transmembrane protein, putative [Tetrahymena thermophila SB210]EWS74432.1 transmembrane protein, putative [Tetrahymena thermophila SB210]|eukprot:XP_012653009.1 transmembrane protein, putative [Tetrahymena thermophila SB210]
MKRKANQKYKDLHQQKKFIQKRFNQFRNIALGTSQINTKEDIFCIEEKKNKHQKNKNLIHQNRILIRFNYQQNISLKLEINKLFIFFLGESKIKLDECQKKIPNLECYKNKLNILCKGGCSYLIYLTILLYLRLFLQIFFKTKFY